MWSFVKLSKKFEFPP